MAPTAGKLEKLTIYPYKDPGFSQSAGSPYVVTINPEKYTHSHNVSYSDEQPIGSAGASSKYDKTLPEKVSFELNFDATGAIPGTSADASQEVENFKAVVYDFNGSIHSPNYLKLSWASLVFNCKLESLEVNYTLFKPDGTPLRAKANASFKGFIDYKTLALQQNKQSPDLTHLIVFKEGDSLPLLCYQVYGSPAYYREVAYANNLTHFRNIAPGTRLYFPPIAK